MEAQRNPFVYGCFTSKGDVSNMKHKMHVINLKCFSKEAHIVKDRLPLNLSADGREKPRSLSLTVPPLIHLHGLWDIIYEALYPLLARRVGGE
jgi:hypothetical protein